MFLARSTCALMFMCNMASPLCGTSSACQKEYFLRLCIIRLLNIMLEYMNYISIIMRLKGSNLKIEKRTLSFVHVYFMSAKLLLLMIILIYTWIRGVCVLRSAEHEGFL